MNDDDGDDAYHDFHVHGFYSYHEGVYHVRHFLCDEFFRHDSRDGHDHALRDYVHGDGDCNRYDFHDDAHCGRFYFHENRDDDAHVHDGSRGHDDDVDDDDDDDQYACGLLDYVQFFHQIGDGYCDRDFRFCCLFRRDHDRDDSVCHAIRVPNYDDDNDVRDHCNDDHCGDFQNARYDDDHCDLNGSYDRDVCDHDVNYHRLLDCEIVNEDETNPNLLLLLQMTTSRQKKRKTEEKI